MQYQNRTHGLDLAAKAAMVKFQKLAVDFEHGTKTPAYVATGVKKQSSVNLTSLGATPEEMALAQLSQAELDNIKFEAFDYESMYGVVLPLHRFIGKTVSQVRAEVENAELVTHALNDADSNDSALAAQLFSSL